MLDRLTSTRSYKDLEHDVLARLKTGTLNTLMSKSEKLLTEWCTTVEDQISFKKWCRENNCPEGSILQAIVLPTSSFDSTTDMSGSRVSVSDLPQFTIKCAAVESAIQAFERYYSRHLNHHKRKLQWLAHKGSIEIIYKPSPQAKKCKMVVPPLVYSVLLIVEKDGPITRKNLLRQFSEKSVKMVKQYLRILSSKHKGKRGILAVRKGSSGREDDPEFSLEPSYSLPSREIPHLTVDSLRSRLSHVEGVAEDNRKLAIDACLVRIMKARLRSSFVDLCNEAIQQLALYFCAPTRLVKSRIENLITLEFFRRDGEKGDSVFYLA